MHTTTSVLRRKVIATQSLTSLGHYGPSSSSSPFLLLIDFDYFRTTLRTCKASFPSHWHHCFAIKANPTRLVLAEAVKEGFGLEAASLGELRMATTRVGAKPSDLVYDSPLKNEREIEEALREGVLLNVDNFQELEVIDQVLERSEPEVKSRARVGIRVNPQVGAGSLASFSTGTLTSKFGIGLRDEDGVPVMEAYRKRPWLSAIMCHVGSQGIPFDLAIQGIRAVVDFALAINKEVGREQVTVVDIGGGMSVNFSSDEVKPTFEDYSAALEAQVPELFDPKVFQRVITEFGRASVVKGGFFVSRVEYSKVTGGRRIAIQYAGADSCVRTVYHPAEWPLRLTLLDNKLEAYGGDGVTREAEGADLGETDIAGPCCIQGDIVAHRRLLPPINRGDTVLLHDVGGYYHSGHTRYNLRQAPAVWAYEDTQEKSGDNISNGLKFTLLQPAETVDQTLDAFCEAGYVPTL